MAEGKIFLMLFNFIGYSLFGYTLFINIDNFKGWVLMIIGSLFGLAKLFFYIKRSFQAVRKADQEAELRDLDILDKHRQHDELKLKQLEKELSLRITGLTPEQRGKKY